MRGKSEEDGNGVEIAEVVEVVSGVGVEINLTAYGLAPG